VKPLEGNSEKIEGNNGTFHPEKLNFYPGHGRLVVN
jgi:hypothetical protein